MNVYETLMEQARLSPDSVALIDDNNINEKTTYAQLVDLAEHCAENLSRHRLEPGDVVLLLEPMSLKLYVVLLTLFKLGVVAMFVDPGWQALKSACGLVRPRAVIGERKAFLYCLLHPALRSITIKIRLSSLCRFRAAESGTSRVSLKREGDFPKPATYTAYPSTPALITFTGGTTGDPKAICRTHGFLADQLAVLKESLHFKAGTVQLVSLPMFVLSNLANRVTSLIPNCDVRHPGRANAQSLIKQMNEHNVEEVLSSPALIERLARCAISHSISLSGIRRICTGGGPVLPRLHNLVKSAMPNAFLTAVYGSTEAEPIAILNYDALSEGEHLSMKSGAGLLAGKTAPGVELKILSHERLDPVCSEEAFDKHCLQPDQAGEIVVSGKHVISGYLNAEQDAQNKINVSGSIWHRTGDAGYLDDKGRLWLLGRCAQLIRDRCGVLYPLALEAQVLEATDARQAAVILLNGERTLVVEPGRCTNYALIESIAGKAKIERVIFAHRLPLDSRHNSKVNCRALLQKLRFE